MNDFWYGFEKQALNLETAKKAVNALKHRLVRKNVHMDWVQGKGNLSNVGQNLGATTAMVKGLPEKFQKMTPFTERDHGKIFAKGPGKLQVQSAGADNPALTGRQKNFLNRVVLLHEGEEVKGILKNKKDPTVWVGNHVSPGVILRENNMLASAPKEFEPVKNLFRASRNLDMTAPVINEVMGNYTHGKIRFSRHAIKRIEESLKSRGMAPSKLKDFAE